MIAMAEELKLTHTVNASCLPVTEKPRLIYLLLEAIEETDAGSTSAASKAQALLRRVNLTIVVDVSESMHIRLATEAQFEELARKGVLQEVLVDGVPAWQSADIPEEAMAHLPRKIDRVKDALQAVVERLEPDDRFAVVAFARQAVTLVPSTTGDDKRRLLDVLDDLDKLQLGDDTYIGRGIALGFDELQRGTSAGLTDRFLVLTDGFTLDEDDCRNWAVRARQMHVPISTMGLGGDFNEELMIPIADQTGGEAYLLEDPGEIPAAFAEELRRAQAVRYRTLELKLRPSQGVEVRAAYRVRPSIAPLETVNDGGSYSFSLGDLVAGEKPTLLLELIVPPRPAGIYRLAQALLAYDDPAGGMINLKTRADIVVEYTPDVGRTAQFAPQVMQVVEALSAYKLQRGAQADIEVGNVPGATRKLRVAATRLLDMGKEELATEMEQQAAELEKHGQADPQRTKRLRYETRKLARR
jgi:Ca-activated chloride channel family protein